MSFVGKTVSVFGVVGLSALATLGIVESASAVTVKAGRDLLFTPDGGATFFFEDLNAFVEFNGLPIDPNNLGLTDTIALRLDDVPESGGTTDLVIEELSLQSAAPVNGQDVFVGLNPNEQSTGTMTINHDSPGSTGGTWSSSFDIHGIAIVAAQGLLTPSGAHFVEELIAGCPNASNYECIPFWKGPFVALNEPWTHAAPPGAIIDPEDPDKNFFLDPEKPVIHDAGDGTIHTVTSTPVPEPTTILGSSIALGFGAFFKKQSSKKRNKKDVS